jgi:hypothetical protein
VAGVVIVGGLLAFAVFVRRAFGTGTSARFAAAGIRAARSVC